MRALFNSLFDHATQTLRLCILIPLTLVVVAITMLESLIITRCVTQIVRSRIVETQMESNEQVLHGIDQYFDEIATIAKRPGNSMEILPILRKRPGDVTSSSLLTDQYTVQMFMFREIMMQNKNFESTLIYHERQDRFYALTDSYLIQQDRQYDFSVPRTDYQTKLSRSTSGQGSTWISGIRPSSMLIQPCSDYVITYMQEIMIPASIKPSPLGAFIINIDVGAFELLYNRYSADPDSDYYIVDSNGYIVACSDKNSLALSIENYIHGTALESQQAHSLISGNRVYTISWASGICGWRVIKSAEKSVIFGYERDILKIIHVCTGILLMFEFITIWAITTKFTKPITFIKAKLMQVACGNMNVRFDEENQHAVAEIREMNIMLQEMLDRINQLIKRIYVEEDEKRKLEMSVLQSQITPHFIYNTLSRIQWMAAMQQADNVASMLGAFSGILTYCSHNTDYYVTLGDELRFIREYIKIMQLRLLNEVEVIYNVPKELLDVSVLRLILQPIVENAFLHAFDDDGTKHQRLLIECKARDDKLFIRGCDNGRGMCSEVLCTLLEEHKPHTKDSIALNNIQKRIRSHYGNSFGLSVESVTGIGTTVTVILPLQYTSAKGDILQ